MLEVLEKKIKLIKNFKKSRELIVAIWVEEIVKHFLYILILV